MGINFKVQKDFGGFLLDNLAFLHTSFCKISSLLHFSNFLSSMNVYVVLMYDISCTCTYMQDILNEEMPELEEFKPPQPQSSDISIELQIPAGLTEVRWEIRPFSYLSIYKIPLHIMLLHKIRCIIIQQ